MHNTIRGVVLKEKDKKQTDGLGSSDRSIISFDMSPHGESESEVRTRGIEPPRRHAMNSGPMHYKCIASTTEPYGQGNRFAVELVLYQAGLSGVCRVYRGAPMRGGGRLAWAGLIGVGPNNQVCGKSTAQQQHTHASRSRRKKALLLSSLIACARLGRRRWMRGSWARPGRHDRFIYKISP
jgi:hypothetical protein